MNLIERNDKNEVVKNNDLIKAQASLSGIAQKMLSSLVSMIRIDDTEFQEYALHIDTFEDAIGRKSNDVEFLKNKALELMGKPFFIFNKKGKKEYFNWCSKVAPYNMDGYIIFKVDNELKPYLLELKNNFTKYQLVNILKLKGNYSPRLYEYLIFRFKTYKNEYLKQNKKNPKKYTFDISIDWIRTTYQIPDTYRYNDIKRQVIIKAQQDFKAYTDIKFTFEEQKIGRKVDRLIITVKENNKGSNDPFRDLESFIVYMRKNYINQDIWKGQGMILSISDSGRIYNKKTLNEYDNKQAQKVWEQWYQLAKDNKLLCLKDK